MRDLSKNSKPDNDDEFQIAIAALDFLASDFEQMNRFFAVSGIDPGSIRAASRTSGFLAGVLAFVMQNEALLLKFCADRNVRPERLARVAHALENSLQHQTEFN